MSLVRKIVLPEQFGPDMVRLLTWLVDDASNILNKGIKVEDQFRLLKTGVEWNSANSPIQISTNNSLIKWVCVLGAREADNLSVVVSFPPVVWTTLTNGDLSITDIQNLTPDVDYIVDLLLLEG